MNIEKSLNFLKPKIVEFEKTKAVKFNHIELQTMKNLYNELYGEVLNLSCRPCVIRCCEKLASYIRNEESLTRSKTKESIVKKPTSSPLNDMKMSELRNLAKELGVKVARSKKDLISNIENNVEK